MTGHYGRDQWGRTPRPPFHPHVQAVMDEVHLPSITPDLVGALREANAESPHDLESRGFERREFNPSPQVRFTAWRHPDKPTGPGHLFLHGGGMVSGNRFAAGDMVPPLLDEGGVLCTIEYRLAPEHPAPVPVEDCIAAVTWAVEHADEVGFDPERVLLAGTRTTAMRRSRRSSSTSSACSGTVSAMTPAGTPCSARPAAPRGCGSTTRPPARTGSATCRRCS